ncbi:uncharacterized protein [Elaeis guineensis]|uniref:Uncharacterized protein LOC105045792 isoform X1 n=2 Tax=Elaeis guineensis var. tenera TaxID=51953 RepID=A0A6I9RFK4_ELAGV|nr:uncharacterized protein LOC105045792 isoform X1 [Elaeis guineensis]
MTTMSDDGEKTCPLCAEEMDLTDQQLKPCKCGYEICVWCWHHIMDMAEKEETEGRCPACRTPYDKERIVGMASKCERVVAEINAEKKLKSQKAKPKASAEARKHLGSVRVIQRNLVYIIGLPSNLCDESILERREYFGQYGKILKVSISRLTGAAAQQASNNNTFSVYITYAREEEAIRCIQAVHNFVLEGKSLRACFGTTKYCHAWLRNMACNNPDCLYLHDIGSQEDSFTKDEIISAYTRSRVPQIASNNSQRRSGNVLPPPVDDLSSSGMVTGKQAVKNVSNNAPSHAKGSPPNTCPGKPTVLPPAASWGLRGSNCRTPAVSAACSQTPVKQKVEMLNGTSLFSSLTASTKQSSAWHDDVVTTSKIPERVHVMPMDGISRPLEPSKSGSVKECRTVVSSEALTDADCASVPSAWNDDVIVPSEKSEPFKSVNEESGMSESDLSLDDVLDSPPTSQNFGSCLSRLLAPVAEDKGRGTTLAGSNTEAMNNRSPKGTDGRSSSADKAAKGSITVNGNIGSLCLGLSSVNIDNHIGHGQSNMDQRQTSKSELSSRPQHCQSKHGVEHLSSEPRSRASVVPDTCIANELFAWDLEPQKQGFTSTEIEKEDEDNNQPSCSSYLHYPDNIANQSGSSSWNNGIAMKRPSYTGDVNSMETKADMASFLSRENKSALCNGHKEDELSCFSKSGKVFESPEMNCSEERITCLGKNDDVATSDNTASVDIGESSIISNILSLDFDPWDDSTSANNFAKLLAETEKQDRLSKLSSSWRSLNSNQSRFSFARQESQAGGPEASFRDNGNAQKLCSSLQDSFGDGFQHGFQFNNFEGPNAVFNKNPAISVDRLGVSRAKISAPPGFSAPSRAPPPGFSSQERFNQSYDSTYSDNHLLRGPSVGNQYQAHLTGNPDDVEFIDPAILAVGKGRMPLGVNGSGFSSKPDFPSQFSPSDGDPRLQLLMQQSISSHQNLRTPDHIGDRFLPLNDAYVTSQLVAQNHGSLSPFAPMSLQPPRSMHISNGQWGGWNDARNGSEIGMPEFLRNERFGLNDFYSGNEEHKFHIASSAGLYSRAFGL